MIKQMADYLLDFVDRYGYLYCERCGCNGSDPDNPLDPPHHIIYRSEARKHKNLHNKKNLILLCRNCHNWFHAKKNRRTYLVIERGLQKLFPNLPI